MWTKLSTNISESIDKLIFAGDVYTINLLVKYNHVSLDDLIDGINRKYTYRTSIMINEYTKDCDSDDFHYAILAEIINLILENYVCNSDIYDLFLKMISDMLNNDGMSLMFVSKNTLNEIRNAVLKLIGVGATIDSGRSNLYILIDDFDSYIMVMPIDIVLNDFEVCTGIGSETFMRALTNYIVDTDNQFENFIEISSCLRERYEEDGDELYGKLNEQIKLKICRIIGDICHNNTDYINFFCKNDSCTKTIFSVMEANGIILDESDTYAFMYLRKLRYDSSYFFKSGVLNLNPDIGIRDIFRGSKGFDKEKILSGEYKEIYQKILNDLYKS